MSTTNGGQVPPVEVPAGTEPTNRADLLLRLQEITNPWEYLELVRLNLSMSERAGLIERFVELLRARPQLEWDPLIMAGKDVWNYTTQTIRDEVKKRARAQGEQTLIVPSLVTPTFLAEAVYGYGKEKQNGYLVYPFNTNGDAPVFQDTIEYERMKYQPPSSRLASESIVLFPNGYEDYGGDKGLLDAIFAYFDRHGQWDQETRALAASYVFLTWVYDKFPVVPYLKFTSDFGAGKTTAQRVVGSICYRPFFASGAVTPSPVFRLIDTYRGTFILDEADFSERSDLWQELKKILLNGHTTGHRVIRSERSPEDGFQVSSYHVFGPKILATRKPFQEVALESRCLTRALPLAVLKADVPLFEDPAFRAEAQRLRNQLLLWRFRKYSSVTVNPRARIDGFDDPRILSMALILRSVIPDQAVQTVVLENLKEANRLLVEMRAESVEADVLAAFIECWNRSTEPKVDIADVRRTVNAARLSRAQSPQDRRAIPLTGRRVGGYAREFGFRVIADTVGKRSDVFLTWKRLNELATRYGVPGPTDKGRPPVRRTPAAPLLPPAGTREPATEGTNRQ